MGATNRRIVLRDDKTVRDHIYKTTCHLEVGLLLSQRFFDGLLQQLQESWE